MSIPSATMLPDRTAVTGTVAWRTSSLESVPSSKAIDVTTRFCINVQPAYHARSAFGPDAFMASLRSTGNCWRTRTRHSSARGSAERRVLWIRTRSTGCVGIRRNPQSEKVTRAESPILLACPSAKTMLVRLGTLEDATVRQVCLTLRWMRLIAQPRVRNWNNRAEELRLLARL